MLRLRMIEEGELERDQQHEFDREDERDVAPEGWAAGPSDDARAASDAWGTPRIPMIQRYGHVRLLATWDRQASGQLPALQ
jgi:hypothetical protein